MTNEEKLIRALIDALGFEVEEINIPANTFGIVNNLNPPAVDYKVVKKPELTYDPLYSSLYKRI